MIRMPSGVRRSKTSHHIPPLWHHQASALLHLRDRHQYMNSTPYQALVKTSGPMMRTPLIYKAAADDQRPVLRHIAHASRSIWSSPSRIIHVELHAGVYSSGLLQRQILAKVVHRTTSVDMKTQLDDRNSSFMHKSHLGRLRTLSAAR